MLKYTSRKSATICHGIFGEYLLCTRQNANHFTLNYPISTSHQHSRIAFIPTPNLYIRKPRHTASKDRREDLNLGTMTREAVSQSIILDYSYKTFQ